MATWLTAHGNQSVVNLNTSVKLATVPKGFTIKRILFNIRLQAVVQDPDAHLMMSSFNYIGLVTLDSSNEATIPDPSTLPLTEPNWPTQRWVHWEQRTMVPICALKLNTGASGITYTDDGARGEIDRGGEVFANVATGHTLDVWLSMTTSGWPRFPSFSQANYWSRVLYD